jgi:hypothetical protein
LDEKLTNRTYHDGAHLDVHHIIHFSRHLSHLDEKLTNRTFWMRNWQTVFFGWEIDKAYFLDDKLTNCTFWMRNWQTVLTMTAFILMSIIFFTSAAISLIRMRPSFLITSTSFSWNFYKYRNNTFIYETEQDRGDIQKEENIQGVI